MTWTAEFMWQQGESKVLKVSLATTAANEDTLLVIAHSL